jgi:hypothetical protein
MIRKAGFNAVELVGETGFNSSPNTRGVLIRAVRTVAGAAAVQAEPSNEPLAVDVPPTA